MNQTMPEPLDPAKTLPLDVPERMFAARYRLTKAIGRGGMGIVWRAEDTKLLRTVALKFLPELVVLDREAMADLAAETRRCLELTHPHIVRVYDLVEERDQAAISMEFVDGASLTDRKLGQPGRCFTPETLAPWIAQLCSALDYAHKKVRIVHRDLKPLNILVNSEGDLKIVDFGIARRLHDSHTRLSNRLRSTAASLAYAGPQQLLGEPPVETDDIYSLGATLYELLTGKAPFYVGDISAQVREVVPPKMSARRAELGIEGRGAIPAAWEETIAACLAKKASGRPQSAGEVAARLGLAPPGMTTRDHMPSPPADTTGKSRRRRITVWAGLGATAVLAALAVFFWQQPTAPENTAGRTGATPATPNPAPAREFFVVVDPPDTGARAWLGPRSDLTVPDDGRLAISDLPDGEHELVVQAAGYQPFTTRITVRDGQGSVDAKLTAVYGRAEITARPGTAVSAVDARGRRHTVGTVPPGGVLRTDQTLPAGTYTFQLTHPDCGDAPPAEAALAVGRVARIAPAQTPLPGELRVFSVPTGADVLVNGAKVGVTPTTLPAQLSEKPLTVEVFLAGYRRIRQTVTLRPKETQTINAGTLTSESGGIELRLGDTPFRLPTAMVRVDGHEVTLAQGRIEGLEAGVHAVEITHRNYELWKQNVTVRDGQAVRTPVKLTPKPGVLTLAVTGPAVYTLTANGKAVPVKNNRATLPAEAELALEISAAGFRTDRRTLTLTAGRPQNLTLTLEKIAVAEKGRPWTIPELGLTLMPIAPGSFAMGSEDGDDNERPVTQVTFKQAFWLGRTEVTQGEWRALMGDTDRSNFKGDNLPLQNVTWDEAMEFCRTLTERERQADRLPADHIYALPTEAQWEYACRAGTTGAFSGRIADMAWHEANSGKAPHPVATRQANAWGLYDMHGNVWEWCADWYVKKPRGGAVVDPKGPASGATRVRRGGSWVINAEYLRSSIRGLAEPDYRNYNLGFRVAQVPTR